MGAHKTKVISIRVPSEDYISIFSSALEEDKSVNAYMLSSLNKLNKLKIDTKKYLSEIEQLKKEHRDVLKQLKAAKEIKPKQVIKEVVKVDEKALKEVRRELHAKGIEVSDLEREVKSQESQNLKIKKELQELKAKLSTKEQSLTNAKKQNLELSSTIAQFKTFINSLDLREHSDGYSLGGRAFSDGKKISY